MHRKLKTVHDFDLQQLRVPYKNNAVAMFCVLPNTKPPRTALLAIIIRLQINCSYYRLMSAYCDQQLVRCLSCMPYNLAFYLICRNRKDGQGKIEKWLPIKCRQIVI